MNLDDAIAYANERPNWLDQELEDKNRTCLVLQEMAEAAGTTTCESSCGGYRIAECHSQGTPEVVFESIEQDPLFWLAYCQAEPCLKFHEWFDLSCDDRCCWDTHADYPALEKWISPPQGFFRWGSPDRWIVAPCDPGVVVKAGFHDALPRNRKSQTTPEFQRDRATSCEIRDYPKTAANATTSVWDVNCIPMYADPTRHFWDSCATNNRTVAVWLEDSVDGSFVGYYLDPIEARMWLPDSCMAEQILPSTLIRVGIPAFVLIFACVGFCVLRRRKGGCQSRTEILEQRATTADE